MARVKETTCLSCPFCSYLKAGVEAEAAPHSLASGGRADWLTDWLAQWLASRPRGLAPSMLPLFAKKLFAPLWAGPLLCPSSTSTTTTTTLSSVYEGRSGGIRAFWPRRGDGHGMIISCLINQHFHRRRCSWRKEGRREGGKEVAVCPSL